MFFDGIVRSLHRIRLMVAFLLLLCFASFGALADLTPAQKTTLLAAIQADQTIKAIYDTGNDTQTAAALNVVANPAFPLWDSRASVFGIVDAIQWDRYTPTDSPDGTAIYTNRTLNIQIKQMNLQLLLTGRGAIDAGKANLRAAIRDAVIALPAGAGGAAVTAGGVNGATVLTAMTRNALLVEKILAGASATTGTVTANVIGWDGPISPGDIASLR